MYILIIIFLLNNLSLLSAQNINDNRLELNIGAQANTTDNILHFTATNNTNKTIEIKHPTHHPSKLIITSPEKIVKDIQYIVCFPSKTDDLLIQSKGKKTFTINIDEYFKGLDFKMKGTYQLVWEYTRRTEDKQLVIERSAPFSFERKEESYYLRAKQQEQEEAMNFIFSVALPARHLANSYVSTPSTTKPLAIMETNKNPLATMQISQEVGDSISLSLTNKSAQVIETSAPSTNLNQIKVTLPSGKEHGLYTIKNNPVISIPPNTTKKWTLNFADLLKIGKITEKGTYTVQWVLGQKKGEKYERWLSPEFVYEF